MADTNWPTYKVGGPGTRGHSGIPNAGSVCFYCGATDGNPHGAECVVVCKRVILSYTFQLEVMVPYHWSPEDIESHRNMGTWCANNALDELDNQEGECLCGVFSCTYVDCVDNSPIERD